MEKYSQLCINYEKTLLENCRELKTGNRDCEMLEQLYKDCLDFKQKKEKTAESTKKNDTEMTILLMSSTR